MTECRRRDEEFIERLAGIAQVLLDTPAAHIVSAVFDTLQEHACHERPPDDASVFIVRRTSA